MKIAFISTFFTGATLPLMKHLSDRGHQTDLFLFSRQGQTDMETLKFDRPTVGDNLIALNKSNQIYSYLNPQSEITLVPYHIVKYRKYLIGFIPYFKNLKIIRHLVAEIKKRNYDLIYMNISEEHDAITCLKLKNKVRKKIVVAYHEVIRNHSSLPELKKPVAMTCNLGLPIVTYSEYTKKQLQGLTKIKSIITSHFGPFETYRLYDTSIPMISKPYVLFIGMLSPYKGLPFLYQTVHNQMKDFSYKFVIAGGGYDSVINKITNDKQFRVINRFLSGQEFANLVCHAKCIVCPYSSGSQSGIPSVAMAYGVPVVATKVGAFEEIITEGQNGCLIDYGNEEQLSAAIRKLTSGKVHMSNEVTERIRWENIVNQLEKDLIQ